MVDMVVRAHQIRWAGWVWVFGFLDFFFGNGFGGIGRCLYGFVVDKKKCEIGLGGLVVWMLLGSEMAAKGSGEA